MPLARPQVWTTPVPFCCPVREVSGALAVGCLPVRRRAAASSCCRVCTSTSLTRATTSSEALGGSPAPSCATLALRAEAMVSAWLRSCRCASFARSRAAATAFPERAQAGCSTCVRSCGGSCGPRSGRELHTRNSAAAWRSAAPRKESMARERREDQRLLLRPFAGFLGADSGALRDAAGGCSAAGWRSSSGGRG